MDKKAKRKEKEKEAAKKLAEPPKDRREITIGPTSGPSGPDITLG